uniref:Uncharacterized protein n=1 Tax=Thermogemmatispora argillosa TaxID=2045280 RepID=A0A455T279_9CHLR|nr:hypothetical protein KTA_07840 [Thermogemmatispora argillosa]
MQSILRSLVVESLAFASGLPASGRRGEAAPPPVLARTGRKEKRLSPASGHHVTILPRCWPLAHHLTQP